MCITRHPFVVAGDRDLTRRTRQWRSGHFHKIVDGERLINRRQRVVAIRPRRANGETKIDLGVGSKACGHDGLIVDGEQCVG